MPDPAEADIKSASHVEISGRAATYLRGYRVDHCSFLSSEARQCKTASQGWVGGEWGILIYFGTRDEGVIYSIALQDNSTDGSRDCSSFAPAWTVFDEDVGRGWSLEQCDCSSLTDDSATFLGI
ncbi:hypothetical protein MRX96_019577 [Rhipicephalus microplus]